MAVKVKTSKKSPTGVGDISSWQSGARQVRGFFDSILGGNPSWNNGLRQLQQANPNLAHGAEEVGSFFTGTPVRKLQKPKGQVQAPQLPKAIPTVQPSDLSGQQDPNSAGQDIGDLQSFLAKAMGIINQYNDGSSSSSGTNYDALRQQLRGQASDSDSRIAAMYRQLQGSYAADAPGIAQTYDTAINSSGQAADQAAGQTNAAYQTARDAQTQQLQALGIGDAAAVLASNGGQAANDQARAVSNIAQNKNAVAQQLGTNKQNAGTYNTEIGQAAGLEGNLQRATIQQQLAQKLAQLDTQQSTEQSSQKQNNFAQALQLASSLYGEASDKQSAAAKAQSDQQKTLYSQYRDQQGDATKRQQIIATLYPALLKQNGGDENAAKQALVSLGLL